MESTTSTHGTIAKVLKAASKIEPNEISAVLVSFVYLFCVMTSYSILRPVRDAMALASNSTNDLPWLFTATFLSSAIAIPVYWAITSKIAPAKFLPWVYAFFSVNLLAFYTSFSLYPGSLAAAYTFFVWVSVFNLFVISVFWSFMASLFDKNQARRLFGFIAAGASTGALVGPAVTGVFVETLGVNNIILISAALLIMSLLCILFLIKIKEEHYRETPDVEESEIAKPIGGHFLSGFPLFFKSSYLMGIGVFILLYTAVSTFLYFFQAGIFIDAFETTALRTKVFSIVDFIVNGLALLTQLFGTARLATRYGLVVTLSLVPLLMVAGFLVLGSAFMMVNAPILIIFLGVQIIRRAGNYAIARPAREMLFTIVGTESKYKVKTLIDTVVYRGGDLVSAWTFAGLEFIGVTLAGIAVIAASVAGVWAAIGALLGRSFEARHRAHETEIGYKSEAESKNA